MKCDICGKSIRFGHNVSHSKHRTKRHWAPNIKTTTMLVNGKKKRVNICTRCLRSQHKIIG